MSVKKAYAKFRKGMDKSAFGIGATTTAKDYGLGDSMFNFGGGKKLKKAGKGGGTPIKQPTKGGSPSRQQSSESKGKGGSPSPTPPSRRP